MLNGDFMKNINVFYIFFIIYFIIWITVTGGIILIKNQNPFAAKVLKWIINKRIVQFKYPPFSIMLKFWIRKKYFITSIIFLIINIFAVLMYFIVGIFLITPFVSVFQGFIAGILIGGYRKKNLLWAVSIGIFEFGYWALSGALGLSVILNYLFNGMSFTSSFLLHLNILMSGYWILIAVCIIINAFGEVAGPVYLNVHGSISLDMLAGRKEIRRI